MIHAHRPSHAHAHTVNTSTHRSANVILLMNATHFVYFECYETSAHRRTKPAKTQLGRIVLNEWEEVRNENNGNVVFVRGWHCPPTPHRTAPRALHFICMFLLPIFGVRGEPGPLLRLLLLLAHLVIISFLLPRPDQTSNDSTKTSGPADTYQMHAHFVRVYSDCGSEWIQINLLPNFATRFCNSSLAMNTRKIRFDEDKTDIT